LSVSLLHHTAQHFWLNQAALPWEGTVQLVRYSAFFGWYMVEVFDL